MATIRARLVIAVAVALIGGVGGKATAGNTDNVTPTPPDPTPTPTRTTSSHRASCVGDCNDDGVVIVGEIVTGVNIALDRADISDCPAFECNGPNVDVFVNCGVGAVRNALGGCPTLTPTPVGFIRYRLLQSESQLIKMDAYPGPIIQTMSWPMSGTLDVIATEPSEGANVFRFTITRIEFAAGDHVVSGHDGEISARAGTGRVVMAATVAIDGDAIEVSGDEPVSVLSDSYPPDLPLRVCGAPGRAASCAALNSGAASGYSLLIRAVPEAVQTPLPTRTPTPTVSVVYELLEGSTILMALPTPGASPIVEPLSGTFVARIDCRDPVECFRVIAPNTLFAMAITSIEFQSPHFTVAGTGYVHALTFVYPPYAYVGGRLLIAGQSIGVSGGGALDRSHFPPSFPGIELCGGDANHAVSCDAIRNGLEGGYVLTIFAAPQP